MEPRTQAASLSAHLPPLGATRFLAGAAAAPVRNPAPRKGPYDQDLAWLMHSSGLR